MGLTELVRKPDPTSALFHSAEYFGTYNNMTTIWVLSNTFTKQEAKENPKEKRKKQQRAKKTSSTVITNTSLRPAISWDLERIFSKYLA